MTRITAPVPGLNGPGVGGVVFTDSVAHTNNQAIIDYCRSSGYLVEEDDAPDKPLDKMSKAELAVVAAERGVDLGDAKVKADILAVIVAAEGDESDAPADSAE